MAQGQYTTIRSPWLQLGRKVQSTERVKQHKRPISRSTTWKQRGRPTGNAAVWPVASMTNGALRKRVLLFCMTPTCQPEVWSLDRCVIWASVSRLDPAFAAAKASMRSKRARSKCQPEPVRIENASRSQSAAVSRPKLIEGK